VGTVCQPGSGIHCAVIFVSSLICTFFCFFFQSNSLARIVFSITPPPTHHFSNSPSLKRNFNVSLLKDEQKEAAVHLWLKDLLQPAPTGFEESLIYQLYAMAKEMHEYQMLESHQSSHSI